MPLDRWLFSKMRRDGVDSGSLSADQAHACFFVAVHRALARTEVAVSEVGVGCGALLGGACGGEVGVAGEVGVVEEERRGEVEGAPRRRGLNVGNRTENTAGLPLRDSHESNCAPFGVEGEERVSRCLSEKRDG